MKRKFLFLTGIVVMGLLVLGSCKKQDPTSLVLDTSKTATITGTVYANLDLFTTGIENAPSGTTLFFKVSNADYIANASGVKIFETTVGADGTYTISIPVTDEGVNVSIDGVDFYYNQVQADQSTDQTAFYIGTSSVSGAITNGNYIVDLMYNY